MRIGPTLNLCVWLAGVLLTTSLHLAAQTSEARRSAVYAGATQQAAILDPKCKPWQTVMMGTRGKWCETDGNKGYPDRFAVVLAYLPHWGKEFTFEQNYWRVDVSKPEFEVGGDMYFGVVNITYHNVNNIPPYRPAYRYAMSLHIGDELKITLEKRKE